MQKFSNFKLMRIRCTHVKVNLRILFVIERGLNFPQVQET